jgi:hypothetical protein
MVLGWLTDEEPITLIQVLIDLYIGIGLFGCEQERSTKKKKTNTHICSFSLCCNMNDNSNIGSFELIEYENELPFSFIETHLKHRNPNEITELPDNWLIDEPNAVALSFKCQYIAILKDGMLFIVNNCANKKKPYATLVNMQNFLLRGEQITSIMWLSMPNSERDQQNKNSIIHVLLIGSSEGYLRILNESGELLLVQLFHTATILKLKTQSIAHFSLLPEQQIESVLVIYANIVVRIENRPLCSLIRRLVLSDSRQIDAEKQFSFYEICELKNQNINDVICCSNMDLSAFDIFKAKAPYFLIACGSCPMIASYINEPDAEYSTLSTSHIAAKYTTKASAAVLTLAKSFFLGKSKRKR